MKEVTCDTCGGEFWQVEEETTCKPCQDMPKPKVAKAEEKKK